MSFPSVPTTFEDKNEWLRRIALTVNRLLKGKMNCTGSVTLTNSTTSTTVALQAGQLGESTVVLLSPVTSDAAAEFSTMYVSARDVLNNTFTITHSNDTTTRTFSYVLLG
jgi:hypothetical protein